MCTTLPTKKTLRWMHIIIYHTYMDNCPIDRMWKRDIFFSNKVHYCYTDSMLCSGTLNSIYLPLTVIVIISCTMCCRTNSMMANRLLNHRNWNICAMHAYKQHVCTLFYSYPFSDLSVSANFLFLFLFHYLFFPFAHSLPYIFLIRVNIHTHSSHTHTYHKYTLKQYIRVHWADRRKVPSNLNICTYLLSTSIRKRHTSQIWQTNKPCQIF